jgi:hypothetical protein
MRHHHTCGLAQQVRVEEALVKEGGGDVDVNLAGDHHQSQVSVVSKE